MDAIRDWVTDFALAGAAVFFAVWLLLIGGRWFTRQLAAIRPYLAAFLVFTLVAMNYAQKSGTNEPPRGASELLRTTEHSETANASTEDGWGRITDRLPQPPVRVAEGASEPSVVEMFRLASVATNETWDFSAPSGAVVHERWQRRGAADDRFALSPAGWSFAIGGMSVTNLKVFSRGMARLPDGTEISPLPAMHGVVPERNWGLLGETNYPSLFWHDVADDGTLTLGWQNVLLHRAATNPVSFQAVLRPSGGVDFRYDLSRLASDELLAGVFPSAGDAALAEPLTRGVTGVSFRSRDEVVCDESREEFEESLDGLDPFSFPEGSTNTVLEHLFYSGTTNGAFVFPQPTDNAAVLRVSVSGSGSGDLLVGDLYVPLVAPPQMRSAPQPNPLMLSVPKFATVPVYLRGDGTLSVSFDSGEFAFGELPSIAANRCAGWINFPDTRATEPCIHNFATRRKRLSLPASSGADGLSCAWSGAQGVQVENLPPRSANVTAAFDARATRTITYTLSHPDRLFGQTEYSQTVRFCPRPPDPDPADPDPEEEPQWFSEGDPPEEDDIEPIEDEDPDEPGAGGGFAADDEDEVCPVHNVPYEQCAHLHAADYTNAVENVSHMTGVLYVRDPPVVGDQIYLAVPDEHVNCCGCPDHWTNCVSLAYKSYSLRVTGPGGEDFSSTGESCTVDVAGVHPSKTVGDAGLAFARNGEIYMQRDYTTLGVAIQHDGVSLERYNALNSTFGFPMTVCTNDWRAPVLNLVTNVRLPSGTVHLEFAGATAPFALWYMRRGESEYRKLLDSEACPVKDIPMSAWRRLVAGVTPGSAASVPVLVTSSAPGTVRLVLRYWTAAGGVFAEDSAVQRITSVNPPLLPDLNYDGSIDSADLAHYLAGRWFRFWTNEDCHKGDYVGQLSDISPNSSDLVVNGAYDLVNLFPLAADFSAIRSAWGNNVTYRLEPDWGDSGAVNFLWANVGRSGYRRMQTETVLDLGGNALSGASLTALPIDGCEIPGSVLGALSGTDGMLVAEAVSNLATLRFVIRDGDDEIFSYSVPLSIYTVRDMYRWLNIRYAAGGAGGEQSRLGEPWNRPDEECDGRQFVFVHGYNVNPDAARQWADAIFKRLWWSGSKSMFTAVDWYGDDSQFSTLAHGDVSPDYYANVMHAFASAPALAANVAALPGTNTVLLAHSLGNMLVSSAIKDCGLSDYSKYYMLNAAVPMEAYDDAAFSSNMVDSAWSNVPITYRASDWSSLFTTNDFRSSLSWCGRFAGIQNTVNCYSETEDVLANPTLHGLGGAWSKQELFKGTTVWHALNAVPFLGLDVACEGGWGINATYAANPYYYVPVHGFFANAMANFTREEAIESPLFTPFKTETAAMHSTNLYTIADADCRCSLRAKFLGDAIPATSFAMGANATNGLEEHYDMQDVVQDNDWPSGRVVNDERKWFHSDIKNVAYFYLHQVFNRIKSGH